MNRLSELLKLVEDSETFKRWKITHNDSYLCSLFKNVSGIQNPEWQFHYYQPEKDTITVFNAGAEIKIVEEDSEILKKKNDKVEELKLDNVKIDLIQALNIIDTFHKNNYPQEIIVNKIIILQKLNRVVWNVTYITTTFNMSNVKVDAESGDIVEESIRQLLKYNKE